MIYIHILLLFYGVAMEQDLSKKTKISRNLPKKEKNKKPVEKFRQAGKHNINPRTSEQLQNELRRFSKIPPSHKMDAKIVDLKL